MAEVSFTPPFKRRLKTLTKRDRQIQIDIQPIIDQLQAGNFIGNQISGIDLTVFKVRAKNSDIPTGKKIGGYRVIYQVVSPECVLLLLIYAKDVSLEEIEDAIKRT